MSIATTSEIEHEIGLSGRLIVHVGSTDVRLRAVAGGSVRVRGQGGAPLDGVDAEPSRDQLTVTVRSGRAPDLEIRPPCRCIREKGALHRRPACPARPKWEASLNRRV